MKFSSLVLLGAAGFVAAASSASAYEPPEGCALIATLRYANCTVAQVSNCPGGAQIKHDFEDGAPVRSTRYDHPALFVAAAYPGGVWFVHDYGEGVPDGPLSPGEAFRYRREVRTNFREPDPGDQGWETLEVGAPAPFVVAGRDVTVLPLSFEVVSDDGTYRYRERALLLDDPRLTIGSDGREIGEDGDVMSSFTRFPEEISLQGEPGFGALDPVAACLPES